ncbi:copper chaperone PCu(A)C [Rhodanobacter sp. Si-c]|uniref:Copper chaperone PCu(A)C n=1 Tax=Rhodanobacter lycopersici TaxID=3162487 RepID=A0ABV3QCS3_9GAMM
MNRLALPLLLAGLLGTGLAHAGPVVHVTASHAWIRVLPGSLPAGAYVTLRNDSDKAVSLTGASSPAYGEAMLHESSAAGGMNRMTMVDALPIPARGMQALQPGGYHLMLMHAKQPVRPGDTVRVVLQFGNGGTLPVDFTARPANAVDDTH